MADDRRLVEVAADGDHLTSLEALRDRLAFQLDDCDSKRDFAALAARFADVLNQIEELEKAKPAPKGTPVDEIARRRSAKAGS